MDDLLFLQILVKKGQVGNSYAFSIVLLIQIHKHYT